MKMRAIAMIPFSALLLCACAPKVYVIDRQTVLEDEAAGNWPDFERELLEKAKARGPTPYSQTPVNTRRARLYNVMNGSLASGTDEANRANETNDAQKSKGRGR